MLRAPTLPPLIRHCHFRFICTICDSLLTAGVSRWSASSLRTQAGSVLLTGMCPASSAVSPHGRCLRSNWRRGETSPTIGGETSAERAGHGGVRAGSAVPAGDTDSFSPSVTMRGPPVLSLGQATETGQGQCQPSRSFPPRGGLRAGGLRAGGVVEKGCRAREERCGGTRLCAHRPASSPLSSRKTALPSLLAVRWGHVTSGLWEKAVDSASRRSLETSPRSSAGPQSLEQGQ